MGVCINAGGMERWPLRAGSQSYKKLQDQISAPFMAYIISCSFDSIPQSEVGRIGYHETKVLDAFLLVQVCKVG